MTLSGTNFDQIDEATMVSLIDNQVPESVRIEFKRKTYGPKDADKKELLKDVSAFANSLGGYLIIGIEEKDRIASAICALPSAGVDPELLRLEGIVRSGLEPALIGCRMAAVPVGDGCVIVIHVPRSHNPPHRVISGGSNRYWIRHSSGVAEASLEELRLLFGQYRSNEDRALAFVNERFTRIRDDDGSLAIPSENGGVSMHLVPIADHAAGRRLSVATLRALEGKFLPIGEGSYGFQINLDGLVARSGENTRGYTQVFRDSSIEAVNTAVISRREDRVRLAGGYLTRNLRRALTQYLAIMRHVGATPPILLKISLFNMAGVELAMKERDVFWDGPLTFRRETLHLPSAMITDYREAGNYDDVLADQMHLLWNAFGLDRCWDFNDQDDYVGRV